MRTSFAARAGEQSFPIIPAAYQTVTGVTVDGLPTPGYSATAAAVTLDFPLTTDAVVEIALDR